MFREAGAACVAAALLTSSFTGAAQAQDPANEARFPACYDDNGEAVQYLSEDEHDIKPGVYIAGARYLQTNPVAGPVILYEPDKIAAMSPIERDFTFAHECYHFSSGDARTAYQYYQKHGEHMDDGEQMAGFEAEADCDAARRMRTVFEYSAEDMRELEDFIHGASGGSNEEREARFAHIMACYEGSSSPAM